MNAESNASLRRSSLSVRDAATVWHPFTQALLSTPPIGITRGQGSLLYDEEGNTYIDAISSWWLTLHGHCHPTIGAALKKQLDTLEHVIFGGFTHEPAVSLAEKLLQIAPRNHARVFFSDNGSTANEVAMKMAIQYWANRGTPRHSLIALRGSYHGDTFGAMAVSERGVFTLPFHDLLLEVRFVDPHQDPDFVVSQFEEVASQDVAAFIFEPLIQGVAGMRAYPAELLDRLIACAHAHDILCIADEVMTGFGRTGPLLASDALSNKPDLICLSKGITGGFLPLGATTCTEAIYEAFLSHDKQKTFFHGHSYTANPLACSAACASIDLLLTPECAAARHRIAAAHAHFLTTIRDHPRCFFPRQLGTICAFNYDTESWDYTCEAHGLLYPFFINRGILLRPLGAVVYVMPPYCISDAELEAVYDSVRDSLNNPPGKTRGNSGE